MYSRLEDVSTGQHSTFIDDPVIYCKKNNINNKNIQTMRKSEDNWMACKQCILEYNTSYFPNLDGVFLKTISHIQILRQNVCFYLLKTDN